MIDPKLRALLDAVDIVGRAPPATITARYGWTKLYQARIAYDDEVPSSRTWVNPTPSFWDRLRWAFDPWAITADYRKD